MKKIKITEKQAKLLGINKINENEESGVGSASVAIGDLVVRAVIEGPSVPKFKDRIIQLVLRQDPTSNVAFFEATGKIVGNIKDIRLQSIARDLKALDPTIEVKKKALNKSLKEGEVKNIVKITKEQYNRIFASGLINEMWDTTITKSGRELPDTKLYSSTKNHQGIQDGDKITSIIGPYAGKNFFGVVDKALPNELYAKFYNVATGQPVSGMEQLVYDYVHKLNESTDVKGGLNRVDKEFKKEFSQADIKENNGLDIVKEPVAGVPNSKMKPSKEAKIKENEETEDPFNNEVVELIKYLYRKNESLSPFWKNNGLSYDAICDTLLSKGLILSKDGRYELSRSLGSPEAAIQAVTDQLRTLVPTQKTSAPVEKSEPVEVDEDNYPAGAKDDPTAPYNQKDPDMSKPDKAKQILFTPVAYNGELIIMKDPNGELYAFYHWVLDKEDWLPYASVERTYTGKDEDGEPDYDYDFDSAKKDAEVITHYVNDNLDTISKGEGLDAWENGVDLVKIDEPLKQDLLQTFDKDKNIVKALGGLQEASWDDAYSSFKDNLKQAATPKPSTGETPEAKQSRIVAKLQQLKQQEKERQEREKAEIAARQASAEDIDEITGAASSGAFVAPMNFDNKKVEETLTVAGAGNFQYDAPGLANVGRNGEFKKGPKTKAQKTPQWAGGEFVEQPSCSKPNNNKEAQNGGCNSGASSLKTKKVSGSINAPSLGENTIYETIAKKTGKTVDEVKAIIESKKGKA